MKLELIHYPPKESTGKPPLLFVHGAWHGAWCWEVYFMPYFAEKGFDCYALSLRGHGQSEGSLRWARVGQYVADVEWAVERIHEEIGHAPILIGHSMGGYVLQKYLETHDAPAAVLLASIPVTGTLPFFVRYILRHPIPFLRAAVTTNVYHIIGTPRLTHDAFFSIDIPQAELERYHMQMRSESYILVFQSALFALARPERVTKRANKTPVFVVAAENDRVFTVAEAQRTARAYGTEAVILPELAHDVMLDTRWQDCAEVVHEWLKSRFNL